MTESIISVLEPADLKLHAAIFQASHGVVYWKAIFCTTWSKSVNRWFQFCLKIGTGLHDNNQMFPLRDVITQMALIVKRNWNPRYSPYFIWNWNKGCLHDDVTGFKYFATRHVNLCLFPNGTEIPSVANPGYGVYNIYDCT